MLTSLLTTPGIGGLLVIAVLVASLTFYGSLVVSIARASKPDNPGPVQEQESQQEPKHERLEGAHT